MTRVRELSPYVELHREQWKELRSSTPLPLTAAELLRLRGLGEQVDLAEVADVYLPLSRLINLQVAARQRLYEATTTFLGDDSRGTKVPYVIGIAGRVAVGKLFSVCFLCLLFVCWLVFFLVVLVFFV